MLLRPDVGVGMGVDVGPDMGVDDGLTLNEPELVAQLFQVPVPDCGR